MDSNHILFGIISLFILVALNAFFVLAEYSLAVSRRTRIAELAERGNVAARIVQRLMHEPDRFFAATQIGITLVSIAIGIVSEPAFASFISLLFGMADREMPWLSGLSVVASAILGLLIASYFQIVLAELVPRSIVLRSPERVALAVVPWMKVLSSLLTPFIWGLRVSSHLVLRLLGLPASTNLERPHSVDELKMLVDASEKGGVLESEERDMLDAVFSFGTTIVREIMVPRTEMVCVDADTALPNVVHQFALQSLSRMPVYEGSLDHIVGVLHIKDLIRTTMGSNRSLLVRQLMREALYVPDTQRADELLRQFRVRHENMAIVLDEYGGTAGLVTLYDLVSEIVGNVGDTRGLATPEIKHQEDGSAEINGFTSIGDVNEAFDLNLVDDNFDTIAGYVMGQLGRIPKVGDVVEVKSQAVRLRVEEMDKLRVAKVRLIRGDMQAQPSPGQA